MYIRLLDFHDMTLRSGHLKLHAMMMMVQMLFNMTSRRLVVPNMMKGLYCLFLLGAHYNMM